MLDDFLACDGQCMSYIQTSERRSFAEREREREREKEGRRENVRKRKMKWK